MNKTLQNKIWEKLNKEQREQFKFKYPHLGNYYNNRTAKRIQRPVLKYLGNLNIGRLARSKVNLDLKNMTKDAIKRNLIRKSKKMNENNYIISLSIEKLGGLNWVLSKLTKEELIDLTYYLNDEVFIFS